MRKWKMEDRNPVWKMVQKGIKRRPEGNNAFDRGPGELKRKRGNACRKENKRVKQSIARHLDRS